MTGSMWSKNKLHHNKTFLRAQHKWQGQIQHFLIGGFNLQKGIWFVTLTLPDFSLIFPYFSENSPWKWNNFVSKPPSFFSYFFLKILHENEIILSQRGVHSNPLPPHNPLWIRHWMVNACSTQPHLSIYRSTWCIEVIIIFTWQTNALIPRT